MRPTFRERFDDASRHDIIAGVVLTAFLVPVGMGYAQASGLPPVFGLYATIVPLLAYALVGPSKLLVLGPDSSLAPLIAATILPLAAGDADRAIALAGALAVGSGVICLVAGWAGFGFLSELLSTPVRHGYLNGIAIVVALSQLPNLLGVATTADSPLGRLVDSFQALRFGEAQAWPVVIGLGSIAVVVLLRRAKPQIPAVLVAVVLGTLTVIAFDLNETVDTVGQLAGGLPSITIPQLQRSDLAPIVAGAFTVAVVTFADTGLLSEAYALRRQQKVDTNSELIALGAANIATGLAQGFPISASSSRTPVAESAGATTQLTGVVAAAVIAVFLVASPDLLADLPLASLAAVVAVAVAGLFEFAAVKHLFWHRPGEFLQSIGATIGVVVLGALWGIGLAVLMSLLAFIERARRPNTATLVRVDGRKGYHELRRHATGKQIPGMLLYRFDAPLFFANASHFHADLLQRIDDAPQLVKWVTVTAEPITNIDATASDMLRALKAELETRNIVLTFAELKGVVRDVLEHDGTARLIGNENFFPTIGRSVAAFVEETNSSWVDWEDEPEK